MPEYDVYFTATASYAITVSAENEDEAIDKAYEDASFPYFPGGMDGDLGEWEADTAEEVG